MLKNSIVYDKNIVNICFKVKAKKDNGQMRAKRAGNFRLRGGTNVTAGGDSKIWGWGSHRFWILCGGILAEASFVWVLCQ